MQDEVFNEIEIALEQGKPLAVATVAASRGSTPRKPGAKMAVREDGTFCGTIGGGCGEAEVWQAAMDVLSSGKPQLVIVDLTESAEGEEVRGHIGSIFETWPDIRFEGRRTYAREGLIVQEWTATATHANRMTRGDLVAEPTGKTITWDGLDVIPFEDGLVKRKDVYSDSVSILRQLGLLG